MRGGQLLLIFLLTLPAAVFAELNVKLEVPESVLVLGDQLELQLKVDGAKQGVQLQLPEIDGLWLRQVGSPVSSSRTVIVNGKIDRFDGLEYTIAVRGQKAGSYRIPPIEIRYRSNVYTTDTVALRVIAPGQQTTMRLELSASEREVFPQEPVVITLQWGISERVEDYEFHFPLLEQKDDLQLQLVEHSATSNAAELQVGSYRIPFGRSSETVDGDAYTLYTAKFRIFIPAAGDFAVPAASVKAQVRRGSRISTNFFGERVRVPKMEAIFAISSPLRIRVKKLPLADRPELFTGAIGDFNIELLSDTTRTKVGDPIDIIVRISGKGRLDTLQIPQLSEIKEFRTQFAVKDNFQPGEIKEGTVSFRRVIRPKRSTIKEIPAVPFSFFHIERGEYVTISSNTLPLKVFPAQKVSQSDVVAFNEQDSTAATVYTKAKRGLQANYTFEDVLQSQTQHWGWISLVAFPPLLYLGLLAHNKYRRSLRDNRALVRAKSAKSIKDGRIRKLKKRIGAGEDFYRELSAVTSEFLSNRLNLGSGELTASDIRDLGHAGRIPTETGEQIATRLEKYDRFRFTGHHSTQEEQEEAHRSIAALLKKLESCPTLR